MKDSKSVLVLLLFSLLYSIMLKASVDNCLEIYPGNRTAHTQTLWDSVQWSYAEDIERVIPLTEIIKSIGEEANDSSQIIRSIKYQGRAYRKMGNYVNSIDAFKVVYDYAHYHKDSLLIAEAADQMGIMNTFMGNMTEGQKYLLEVADIYNDVGSLADIAGANNGLAIFYSDMDQHEKAIKMYELSLSQYEAIDDTMGRANIHANLGLLYMDQNRFSLAEKHILMQGHLDSLLDTQWGLGFYHDFMGSLRRKQGRYEESLKWHKSSLKIREKLPSHYNIAESRAGLASTYLTLGDYHQSIQESELILKHKKLHGSLSQQVNAYKLLSEANEKLGNTDLALSYYKSYKTLSDSIYNRDMLSEIADKDALYQKAKKDTEIQRLDAANLIAANKLTAKNRIIIVFLISIFVVCGLLFILYSLLENVSKKKKALAKTLGEKDILLREIHHRVKNNLQLVSSLLTLQSKSITDESALYALNEGKSRVKSMALIHQNLYNRDNITGISIKDYLSKLVIELYATYSINREQIKLDVDIDDLNLDIDTVIPLGLILNELISNALKYAFPENREGKLSILIKQRDKQLFLRLKDNGVGYDPNTIQDKSFGFTLIKSLTKQLDGVMSTSSSDGTTIDIAINSYKLAS